MTDPHDGATHFLEVPAVGELFEQVMRLTDANSRTFGLVPRAWMTDYAHSGHLLAVVDDTAGTGDPRVTGFVAFRLPPNEVAIAYLGVDPAARNVGVARALVQELSRRYAHRRGLRLWCRRDFAAHHVWPRLGFVPLADKPGRSRDGKPLTLWWRNHGHYDLLSWTGGSGDVIPVAVDMNVFLDLFDEDCPGPKADVVRAVMFDHLRDDVEIVVTDELFAELDRQPDSAKRARLIGVARRLHHLSVHADDARAMAQRMINRLPTAPTRQQDISDLNHVAYAMAAEIDVFVTNDGDLRNLLGPPAAAIAKTSLVAPEDLVTFVDQSKDVASYAPVSLLGTGFTVSEVGLDDSASTALFLDSRLGERRRHFEARLRDLAVPSPHAHRLLIRDPAKQPVALLGYRQDGSVLDVPVSRVRQRSTSQTVAAQLVDLLRRRAVHAGLSAVRLTDPHADLAVRSAALDDGFHVTTAQTMVALCPTTLTTRAAAAADLRAAATVLTADEQAALQPLIDTVTTTEGEGEAERTAAIEHLARPLRVTDAPIDTWLVPIRPHYASQLFDFAPDLFGRRDDLGISLEHVYYRGGRSGERAPARILWYVSGHKLLIACSQLIEVVDGPPDTVWRRFRRLGIYERADVRGAVSKQHGVVRALRVIDTELFARPVALDTLRDLATGNGQRLNPQWPQRLNQATFTAIMQEARA